MKTITISDEVYRKLVAIKGDKTFSQVIDELIRRDVGRRAERIIEVCSRRVEGVEELEEIVRAIRESFKVRY
ncbi:MAG: antitoxin VapB family protein [Thermoprotei archaeon]|nr:antitoxin VapB family protein [Thermoprotei archaeon]